MVFEKRGIHWNSHILFLLPEKQVVFGRHFFTQKIQSEEDEEEEEDEEDEEDEDKERSTTMATDGDDDGKKKGEKNEDFARLHRENDAKALLLKEKCEEISALNKHVEQHARATKRAEEERAKEREEAERWKREEKKMKVRLVE